MGGGLLVFQLSMQHACLLASPSMLIFFYLFYFLGNLMDLAYTCSSQVPLFNILKKFDSETITEVVRPQIARMRYRVTKLPPYIIMHMRRFTKNNFFVEKNPTLGKYCASCHNFCVHQCMIGLVVITRWVLVISSLSFLCCFNLPCVHLKQYFVNLMLLPYVG